jgi:hypothetical protein
VLAEGLIRSNACSAVIANQLSVPTKSIAYFVETLFKSLLTTGNVDEAVSEGRVALSVALANVGNDAAIEWGIPVLYRLRGGAKLFQV